MRSISNWLPILMVIFCSLPLRAQVTESLGEFFDRVREKQIQPTPLDVSHWEKNFQPPSSQFQLSRFLQSDEQIKNLVTSDLSFVSGRLVDGQIVVRAKSRGKEYDLYFGDWIYIDSALTALQSAIGFHHSKKEIISEQKVKMNSDQFSQLLRLWRSAEQKVRWSDYWSATQSRDQKSLKLKRALMVEVDQAWSPRLSWTNLYNQENAGLLTIFSVWLQCGNLVSQRNIESNENGDIRLAGFRYCAGYALNSGTPNMFAPNVFNRVRGKSRELNYEFNLVGRDQGFRQALGKVTQLDFYEFLKLSDQINQTTIESHFLHQGYSPGMAELLSAKLIHRRNEMVKVFNRLSGRVLFSEKPLKNKLKNINEEGYIEEGILIKDYEAFKVDQTESVISFLFNKIAKPALKSIESTAKLMLEQFPYMGVELIKFGQSYIGAGILFRIKRKVELNQDSTGIHDRYLVRDVIKVGLTINLGRNFNSVPRINLWASAGAGYMASYSLQKYVSSIEEAEKQYWMIPYNLIFETDFNALNPGETLSVQGGFLGIGGFGGNLKIHKAIRPAGYMLTSANFLNTFQVTRTPDDHFFITQGEDDHWSLQTKLYLRIVNRFFRIPFFGYTFKSGGGYNKRFYLSRDLINSLDFENQERFDRLLQATLDTRDVSELEKLVGYVRTDFDYTSSSGFINLFGIRMVDSDSHGVFTVESFLGEDDELKSDLEAMDSNSEIAESVDRPKQPNIPNTNSRNNRESTNAEVASVPEIKQENVFKDQIPRAVAPEKKDQNQFATFKPDGHYFVTNTMDSIVSTDADSTENSRCQSTGILKYESARRKEIEDGSISFRCFIRVSLRGPRDFEDLKEYLRQYTLFKSEDFYSGLLELREYSLTEPLTVDIEYSGHIYWPSLKKLVVLDNQVNRELLDSAIDRFLKAIGDRSESVIRHRRLFMSQQMWAYQNIRRPEDRLEEILKYIFKSHSYGNTLTTGEEFRSQLFSEFEYKFARLKFNFESQLSTFNHVDSNKLGKEEYPPTVKYYIWRETPGIKGILDDM